MISIRWRLTLFLGLGIGLLLLVTGLGIFFAFKDALLSRFDETLTAKARALITASEIDGGEFEIDLTVKKFAGFGKDGDEFFQIRRRDGSLFLNSPALKKSSEILEEFATFSWPEDESGVIVEGRLEDENPARFYLQPIYPKDDKENEFQDLYLIVGSPLESIQRQLKVLALVLAIAGGGALLFMIPVIRFVLNKGLQPLDQLSNEVGTIRTDHLDRRLAIDSLPRELAPMAAALNVWLAELERSFERERRFTRHAAHELRTPLAELRLMAEVGTMSAEEATPEHCAEMVKVADELTALLEKLALLARADASSEPVAIVDVDVVSSLEAALARFREDAENRDLVITTEIEPGSFQTDPLLWGTILQNLIQNAVSYAPPSSEIRITAAPGLLRVSNRAPALSEEDLPHLFERFWRKDASHSGYGHSGLGMSIVHSHSKLLGGNCEVALREGWLTVGARLGKEP